MKKCCLILGMTLMLAGCANTEPTFETVSDVCAQPAAAAPRQILLEIPNEAAQTVLSGNDTDKLYLCEDYSIAVQTMAAGDLDRTVRAVSGYGREELTILKSSAESYTRYDFVWVSAGEGGNQVGKATILDDGNYHYALSCMASEEKSEEVASAWDRIFSSFWLG